MVRDKFVGAGLKRSNTCLKQTLKYMKKNQNSIIMLKDFLGDGIFAVDGWKWKTVKKKVGGGGGTK